MITRLDLKFLGKCSNLFIKNIKLSKYHTPLIKFHINQSKFYKPKMPIQSLFDNNSIQYNSSSSGVFRLKYCPFCKKPHHNDPTNMYTLSVNKQNGLYFCHRCQSKGSYLDLKRAILGINVDLIHNQFTPTIQQIDNNTISQAQYFIYTQNMKKQQFKDVIEYLNSRGLTNQTIQKYNIGCGYQIFYNSDGDSINVKVMYFPMYKVLSVEEQKKKLMNIVDQQNYKTNYMIQLVKMKIRGVGKQNKKYMRQLPAGNSKGLFGLQTAKISDKTIVLTQGQLDAMSVYQKLGLPSLSLPQGANSLPDSVLSYLDQFEKIILWMDNDDAGKMNIDKFATKLGVSRTFIVINNDKECKDANDFLQKKPEQIQQLVNKAKTLPDQNVLTFDSIRQQVKQRLINSKKYQGVKVQTFPFFNKKVKGVRNAQISIVSGSTGSGKTTLLSQISLQLSKKKIPVLWGSFQIRNEILIQNMLTQFSDINLKKNIVQFDQFADKFVDLPIYYMSFHGSNNVNKVLGTITYAIQKYGVSFIVIDTLQFFLSGQGQGYKKFDLQDYVMSQLRSIATNYNVHIAIVIHPRKTQDNQDIGIHSIYGTSKATQQADNIWIVQNRNGFKIFDIKKNRYDGETGRVAIGFNKQNKKFFQLRKKQLQALFNEEKTVQQIIEERQTQNQQNKTQKKWFQMQDEILQGNQPEFRRETNYKRKF